MKGTSRIATLGAAILTVAAATAQADTFSGNFGDSGNSALVGSDLGAALFTDANAIANNVALYHVVVPMAETVSIQSTGFAAGGAGPYFTLFQGTGGSATFLASNYNQAFYGGGGDFTYSGSLAAGSYEIALGVFANMSFAENGGSGTLADGFIGLGDPNSLGSGAYSVQVQAGTAQAPEMDPMSASSAVTLLLGGLAVLRGRRSASTCAREE